MITFKLSGQRIYTFGCIETIATDSVNQVKIEFERGEDWQNLDLTAQFTRGEKTYNVHLGQESTCSLPAEIGEGELLVSAFAVDGDIRRNTAVPFKVQVKKSGFVGDGETPIPPTPDLYQQIIKEFRKTVENGAVVFVPAVSESGVVSWTNTGNLPNPEPVSVKGKDGYTPVRGVDFMNEDDLNWATGWMDENISEKLGVIENGSY